jgi:hypothetical protein
MQTSDHRPNRERAGLQVADVGANRIGMVDSSLVGKIASFQRDAPNWKSQDFRRLVSYQPPKTLTLARLAQALAHAMRRPRAPVPCEMRTSLRGPVETRR